MIEQRLEGHGPLAAAVMRLPQGGCRGWVRRCKRVREGRMSVATEGYCQARQKLSIPTVKQIMDDFFDCLRVVWREGWLGLGQPVFLLDGATLLLEHSDDLVRAYPPASNQRGASHWPTVRLVVAHDVESGLAVGPAWGGRQGSEGDQRTEADRSRPGTLAGGLNRAGRPEFRGLCGGLAGAAESAGRAVALEQRQRP